MMEDVNKAFGYERGGDSTEVYFKKIEKLVKNIMKKNEQHIFYYTARKIKNYKTKGK